MADGSFATTVNYERAGPSFLSSQPAEMLGPQPLVPNWPEFRDYLEQRMKGMYSWRLSWWQHWALLAQYIMPRRYHWLITPNTMSRGLPINQQIVDPTGTQAMRICASGLMSGLTSPSRPWFRFKPRNANAVVDREAQIWYDEAESRIYQIMSNSNFYDIMAQMYEDLCVFGTAPVIVYEDDRDIIRLYLPCAGEYFLASSGSFRNDTLYRQFTMTIAQMVEFFGLENCPQEIRELWSSKQSNLETERIVAHAIEPNFPVMVRGKGSAVRPVTANYEYREVYWLWGASPNAPFSVRGFNTSPFVSPRWATTSNDPYGRSVGMDVLPDIMQLQVETRRKAEAIEKQVRPPMLASIELKNEPSSILPGHITYVANLGPQTGMRPVYEVQPELQYMTADLMQIQDRIKKGFFTDLFLMLQDVTKEMTAFEVAEKKQEKLQVIGPVIERLQNEALAPLIKRIFKIAVAKGMLPPAPDSVLKAGMDIEYISMLALAQKAAATAGMERLVQMAGSLAAANPDVLDLIDDDEFVREYGGLLMVPQKLYRSREDVAKIRAARQQQQQQQAQAEMMAQAGTDGVAAAKSLGDTDVGGGMNALQMMLGNAAGGPSAEM